MLIPIRKLKAVSTFASKDEVRYYLNGVYVEFDKGNSVNLVATDGHRLILMNEKSEQRLNKKKGNFIIPIGLINKIKIDKNAKHCEIIRGKDREITLLYNGDAFKGETIDGTYPDYKRVLPKKEKKFKGLMNIGFNCSYVGDFKKVHDILDEKSLAIKIEFFGEHSPTLVTPSFFGENNYTAVLMPVRV